MIKVIYEDNHLLVVVKPINMPTQEDNSKDLDLLNALKKYIKEKYNKPGNVYLGLVHRLDRPVGGVMVFAKTSKAASRLNEQIKNNLVKKTYYAVICGNLSGKGSFEDYLIKDEKKNISYVSDKGKYSKLNYEVIGNKDNKTLVNYKNNIYDKEEAKEIKKIPDIKEDTIISNLNLPGINEDTFIDIDGKNYIK